MRPCPPHLSNIIPKSVGGYQRSFRLNCRAKGNGFLYNNHTVFPWFHGAVREVLTETFDILDCRGVKTGEIIERDEAHRTGVWHGAFHCLIIYEREGRGYALFQKRAAQKKIAPGKFDVSVGGHYASGEDAELAGPREIKEELGLDVRFEDLTPLGRRVFVYCFAPGIIEHEFQDVFLLHQAVSPEELALQREELDGVIEMDVEEGIALFSRKQSRVDVALVGADGSSERVLVSESDFVPCVDRYYLKLISLGRQYVRGVRDLLII
jgi:isopentenyldiphosphate isomerase